MDDTRESPLNRFVFVQIIKKAITQNKEGEYKVLLTVADRLQSATRREDTVSRWGGDEFVRLLLEVKQEADVVRLAELIVNRISTGDIINYEGLNLLNI